MIWHSLVDPALSERLCLTLLHSVWQVALLALAAWCLDQLRRIRQADRRGIAKLVEARYRAGTAEQGDVLDTRLLRLSTGLSILKQKNAKSPNSWRGLRSQPKAVSIILRNQSLTAPRREARRRIDRALPFGARLNGL